MQKCHALFNCFFSLFQFFFLSAKMWCLQPVSVLLFLTFPLVLSSSDAGSECEWVSMELKTECPVFSKGCFDLAHPTADQFCYPVAIGDPVQTTDWCRVIDCKQGGLNWKDWPAFFHDDKAAEEESHVLKITFGVLTPVVLIPLGVAVYCYFKKVKRLQ